MTGETGQFQPTGNATQTLAAVQSTGVRAASGATGTPSTTASRVPAELANIASAGQPGATVYKIGPQDVLEIVVFKVPDLSRTVQVGEYGNVNLPLIGETQAAGRTAQDVERELIQKYGGKYLQSPQISVYVREFNSQRVTVEGAVKKPGVYPIRGRMTLLQLMAQCEGIDQQIATNEVVVFRHMNGKKHGARFDIDAIRSGKSEDVPVAAGDVVVVTSSEAKIAFNNLLKALPLASVFVPLL